MPPFLSDSAPTSDYHTENRAPILADGHCGEVEELDHCLKVFAIQDDDAATAVVHETATTANETTEKR
jgi:3-oxoacyl-(acyl-carrier-protein) synthase